MRFSFIFIAILAIGLAACRTPNRVMQEDVWIVSGQSNACGRGNLPGPAPDERVRAFDPKHERWVIAKDPLPGIGTGGVGPWVYAARDVAEALDLRIKMGLNGLGGHIIGFWQEDQFLGRGLAKRIEQVGPGVGVFLWYQGESNAGSPVWVYKRELNQIVGNVRRQAEDPRLLVVIVQIGSCSSSDFTSVREAERQFVCEDPNSVLVPALGRSMKDSVHLDTAGYGTLGREIALAVLRHRHARCDTQWPGPVMDRAVLADDCQTIVAHFAEVRTLQGAQSEDFVLLRGDERIACKLLSEGKTLVTLKSERPVRLPARLSYGGRPAPGSSLQDEAGNHAPGVVLRLTQDDSPKDRWSEAPNGAGKAR